ncbi:MAG: hypothetical protein JWN49_498 [Parcubacteria group bacterium]|nr:hypothetical protein [Parcubacteria group bacterium]
MNTKIVGSLIVVVVIAAVTYAYYIHKNASRPSGSNSISTSSQTSSNATIGTRTDLALADIVGEYIRTREDGTNSGSITITKSDSGKIHISGTAFWGTAPNFGDIDTDVRLVHNKAQYVEGEGKDICAVDFMFSKQALEATVVNYDGCDWGVNVDFSGHYSKK